MEELGGGGETALFRGDEIALVEADRLVGGIGILQQRLHAEDFGIGDGVGLGVDGPSGDRVVGGLGLVGFGQAGFLVLAADPPGEGALGIAGGDQGGREMDLEFVAFRVLADGTVADQG